MDKAYIPKGMVITGSVECDGDLNLEGEVIGNVSIEGTLELKGNIRGNKLRVGRVELSEGVIESDIECKDYISVGKDVTIFGNVKAANADVDGAIKGNIDIDEKILVGGSAVISGVLNANEVGIDMGARCDIDFTKNVNKEKKAAAFFEQYMKEHNID